MGDAGLSVYAQRLEAAILEELKQALTEMENEEQRGQHSEPRQVGNGERESGDMEEL